MKIDARAGVNISEMSKYRTYTRPHATVTINPLALQGVETGRIVALSGPSGAGKTTLADALNGHRDYGTVSKLTTRRPRNEASADQYVGADTIAERRDRGDFLYFMLFAGQQYLVPAVPVLNLLKADLTVLIDTPTMAALGLKETMPDKVTTVFVDVPEPETTLPDRMRRRGDTEEDIARRIAGDQTHVYPLRNQFDVVYLNTNTPEQDISTALQRREVVFESK